MQLSDLTDFEWKNFYIIPPYKSKKETENILSIKSDQIIDNVIDENIIYLIFTNKGEIVSQIFGRKEKLEIEFDVGKNENGLKLNKDECIFSVEEQNDEKIYKLKNMEMVFVIILEMYL